MTRPKAATERVTNTEMDLKVESERSTSEKEEKTEVF